MNQKKQDLSPDKTAQLLINMAFKGPCGAAPATPQTSGLEEGDPGARPQVEEVVLRVLRDSLALVAVVVHVEAGTPEYRSQLIGYRFCNIQNLYDSCAITNPRQTTPRQTINRHKKPYT